MEQQAHEESMRQRQRDAEERERQDRIAAENQRQANRNAEMIALCTGCPKAGWCIHKGRYASDCASYKR